MSTCLLCDFLLTDQQVPGGRWIKADSLIASAANGCEGCDILQQGVIPFVKGWSAAEEGGSVYQVAFSRKFDSNVLRCMGHVHQRHEKRDEQIKFEYYSTEESPSRWKGIPPAAHLPRDPRSPRRWELVRRRLLNCRHHHSGCGEGRATPLPSRVLDLSAVQFEEPAKVKPGHSIFLRDTRNTPGLRGQYLCLSYCWGSHLPFRTLTATLPEMEKSIPWDKMPETFQDAVHLTKVLGISYLWIDALCIVQDDPADWSGEASRMAAIYSNSYLTVAATFAENSDSGLYSLLDANGAQQHQLPGTNGTVFVRLARHATSIDMIDDTYVPVVTQIPADPKSIDHVSSSICRTPLMTRAWPLQEYLLPSRILQFGPREMIWECNADIFCECRISFTTVADPMTTYTWFRILSVYTATKLTYQEDKLTALSGIASIIKGITGWAYYAGIWEHHIVENLQWRSFNFYCRPAVYTAPTWSWASSTEPVGFFGWNDETAVVDVLDIACTPAGADVCGRVTDGYIVLDGPVLEVTEVLDRDAENGPFLSWRDQSIEYGSDHLHSPPIASQTPPEALTCLILSTGYDVIHNNDQMLSALLLRRYSGTKTRTTNERLFERVGYYSGPFFNNAYVEHMERQTLRIV